MPRGAKTPAEKRKRQLANANRKKKAKARERKAKADGKKLDYDETIRARAVEKAGIPADVWAAFLTVLRAERHPGRVSVAELQQALHVLRTAADPEPEKRADRRVPIRRT